MTDTAMKGNAPKRDNGGDYATTKESSCQTCVHRSKSSPDLCVAFHLGIPVEILLGEVMHDEPYKGDHGIQYEAAV